MGIIVGILGVTLCVIGGFLYVGGNLAVLLQPSEFVVIGGAALFGIVIGNPASSIKATIAAILTAMKGTGINKEMYNQLLGLMASIFDTMRKEGVLGIEGDLADPHKSARFGKFPKVLHDHHLMDTFTSALRMFVDGVVNAFDLERIMDTELEAHHEEALIPPTMIQKLGDTLPGLGIVAAVLGIIVTMGFLDQPPQVIGHHVGAALVGTMLGVLFAYGYVGPLSSRLESVVKEQGAILKCVKAGLVSFAGGAPPQVALEFARKSIPPMMRPTAEELEKIIKEAKK